MDRRRQALLGRAGRSPKRPAARREQVYRGQVIGEHTRQGDLEVNIVKGKKLTNMRASGSDEGLRIAPKLKFSLEEAMEQIKDDEYLEITPLNLRMRKVPSYKFA